MKVDIIKQERGKGEKPIYFLVLNGTDEKDYAKLGEILFESNDGYNFCAGTPLQAGDRIVSLTMQLRGDTI